jgi:GT2 family glycosyltransferase
MPFVSVVMPNWNGKDDTLECLDSLRNLNYPKDRVEIIVVDNGSKDGSPEIIKEKFSAMKQDGYSSLKLIELPKNVGAPAAINRGIENAQPDYDYVFKIDNDVVFDKESLRELVRVSENDENIGIAGGKVYFFENKRLIQSAGGKMNLWRGWAITTGYKEMDIGQYEKVQEVDWICGAFMLLKKKTVEEIGLFDDIFFVYYDETDFAIRAKRANYKVLYTPYAMIWHKLSVAVQKIRNLNLHYMTRNRIIFQRKHSHNFQFFFFNLSFWFYEFPIRFIKELRKDRRILEVYVNAIREGYFTPL